MSEKKTVSLRKLFDEAIAKQRRTKPVKRKKKYNNNKSGFFKVQKNKCKSCKQGFTWVYRVSTEDGEHKICRTNILRLRKDIKDMGLPWYVINEERASKTAKETHYSLDTLR